MIHSPPGSNTTPVSSKNSWVGWWSETREVGLIEAMPPAAPACLLFCGATAGTAGTSGRQLCHAST